MSDLIDRQAAIRWVKTECNPYGKPTLEFESGKRVIEHLEQMPSAQPERKKGKWLECESYYYELHFKCSVCGKNEAMPTRMYKPIWEYCPNCGAKMDGGRDNG